MKYLFIELFTEFQCVGGECPDTCCKGWTIYVDELSMEKYAALPEPLRSSVLERIKDLNGRKAMKLDEESRCPFWNAQGLCDMYDIISVDALCNTCQIYPRKIVNYYDVMLLTVSLSCPEVARLLLEHSGGLKFQFTEDDNYVDTTGANLTWYNELINGLVITMDILQERNIPLWKRLHMVLDVSGLVQKYADEGRLNDLRGEIQNYKDLDWRTRQYVEMERHGGKVNNLVQFLNELFDTITSIGEELYVMKSFTRVNLPTDEANLLQWMEDFKYNGRDESEYEKIATQLAFEYYMNALNGVALDINIVKILVYLILLQTQEMYIAHQGSLLKEDRILLISKLSRVLEHSSMFDVIANSLLKANSRESLYGLLSIFR